jgi:hypothetical protein
VVSNSDFQQTVRSIWVRAPAYLVSPLVLATSLFSAIGGNQLSVMKSQDEILRARKISYRHSILQQLVRWSRSLLVRQSNFGTRFILWNIHIVS